MTERLRQLPVRPTARCALGRRLSPAFPLRRGKKNSGMPVFTEALSFCIYSTARNPPSSSGPHELVHRMTGTHTGCLTLGRFGSAHKYRQGWCQKPTRSTGPDTSSSIKTTSPQSSTESKMRLQILEHHRK